MKDEEIRRLPPHEAANLAIAYREKAEGLGRELQESRRDTAAALFRARIAEWAVVGVARSKAVLIELSPGLLMGARVNPAELVERFGQQAGAELLHRAGLAFRDGYLIHQMHDHILGLEHNLRSLGGKFKPWEGPSLASFDPMSSPLPDFPRPAEAAR